LPGVTGVITVLVPWGVKHSSMAQAVLDTAPQGAHLVFSCGPHIMRDGQDIYRKLITQTSSDLLVEETQLGWTTPGRDLSNIPASAAR